MRIAIDVSPLQSGHKLRGVGSYTEQLISALQRYENNNSYHLFTRGQIVPKSVELVHYPYFDPFFLTLPIVKVKPTIVTVHDLIPIANEKHFPRGIRGKIKWQIQRASLGSAKEIIADSIASQKDIHKFTGIPVENISVIYLAPSESFQRIADNKELIKIKDLYSLPSRFILYVGDVNWNKNIDGLLHAFDAVRKHKLGVKLVLVGKQFLNKNLAETYHINKKIAALHLEKDIIMPGFVKNQELAAIYSLATVYVQPSFSEGFGFPVLEAMACGCPVICSNTSSLAEIAGPAITVNPYYPNDIASAIESILHLSIRKRAMVMNRGFTWVKRFSWKNVARRTALVYEKALD